MKKYNLKQFLIDEGVLHLYQLNCKEWYDEILDLSSKEKYKNIIYKALHSLEISGIINAFSFGDSNEGFSFWYDMHKKYEDYIIDHS